MTDTINQFFFPCTLILYFAIAYCWAIAPVVPAVNSIDLSIELPAPTTQLLDLSIEPTVAPTESTQPIETPEFITSDHTFHKPKRKVTNRKFVTRKIVASRPKVIRYGTLTLPLVVSIERYTASIDATIAQ
jgi:hypothetical protein